MTIEITKKTHPGYREWKILPPKIKKQLSGAGGYFGKWQYFYDGPRGIISMICLKDYYNKGEDIYEIYCIYGTISLKEELPDVIRFNSKKEAEITIKELLTKSA